jgi:hypothetical protein
MTVSIVMPKRCQKELFLYVIRGRGKGLKERKHHSSPEKKKVSISESEEKTNDGRN